MFSNRKPSRKWLKYDTIDNSDDESMNNTLLDPLDTYLDSARMSKAQLADIGGVLKYWEHACTTQPRLAQMTLDFLSAPGA